MEETIQVRVEVGREIKEISSDFAQALEVLRESLANAYDAGAERIEVRCLPGDDQSGRRILTLEVIDDGIGMDRARLAGFFSLGVSQKPRVANRPPVGFKGHGTKIYYRALHVWVATRTSNGPLLVAGADSIRETVNRAHEPVPRVWEGPAAEAKAAEVGLHAPAERGTSIRLVDFTADSGRLIDQFARTKVENYLRWFTIHGSFEHVVRGTSPVPPYRLLLKASDDTEVAEVPFGHPWPNDCTDLRELKARDPRRPFTFFVKTFRTQNRDVSGGYKVDIAVAYEGARGRRERDPCIRWQGHKGGVYLEEERYGLWLCKNHIPIEMRSEWLQDEELVAPAFLDPKRARVLVNCDHFLLTANRGSIGNSNPALTEAVRRSVVEYLAEVVEGDDDIQKFFEEYEEDLLARKREADQKALVRRIRRHNEKQLCRITAPDGRTLEFLEPSREITFFGLLSKFELWDPQLLELDTLDYDDHRGIDLLTRKPTDPGDLTSREQIAYVELKHTLEQRLNHPFSLLHAIVCWNKAIAQNDTVRDVAGASFQLTETKRDGITYSQLVAPPDDKKHKHNVRVVVVKRLLQECRQLQMSANPYAVNGGRRKV